MLAELIEHLSLERFVLFGHSMGGSIAIGLANQMPARIAGLILVDPNLHGGGGILSRRVVAYTERSYALHGHVELATELAAQGHPAWAETWRRANAVALHRSAASLVKGTSPSWRDTLAALHLQRTLIISRDYGREDDVALLARSGVRVNPILDAGHFMNLEQPLALANAIRLAVTS
ncbi:MAG: hypothetical protein ABS75_32120 [Pelagibacterium sp. SCN 63-23]|nr:MAG: hypothetical protein ABS75_32120 [Pelagibacterium sp. SCN 63-23]